MGKVATWLSMSLDGFIAGPNDRPESLLGDGGVRLFSSRFVCAERYLQATVVEGFHETLHEGFVLVPHQISCLVWKWDGTRRPRPTRVSRWPERSWSPARSSQRRSPTQLGPGARGCTQGRSG
jgi:hypothetical protein